MKLQIRILFLPMFFLFLFAGESLAQSDTSVWEMVEREGGLGAPIDKFAYVAMGDTLIEGKRFQKLWKYQYEKNHPDYYDLPPYNISDTLLVGYLYRDSVKIQAKITGIARDFCPYHDMCLDSVITLYRFDLKTGDTLPLPCETDFQDSVGNVIPRSSNQGKKQIELWQYGFTYRITENIGSEYGLFNRCYPIEFEEDKFELMQYCDDLDSCQLEAIVSGMDERFSTGPGIKVYPNPTSNHLNIQLGSQADYAFSIRDVTGRLHQHSDKISSSHAQINVSNLTNGIYFLEIRKEGRIVGRKKVVVH